MMYPTLLVAAGRDPFDVLSEVMIQRQMGSDEYIYHPGVSTPGRVHVGAPENYTPVNHEWLQKWHSENPEYALRSPYHVKIHDPHAFSDRPAIAMPSVDEIASNHHEISADVVHKPTNKKVGDFHFTLANWPELPSGKNIGTTHIWSFYRHDKPDYGEDDPHHGIMTDILHSWVNHAKEQGIRHGFIQGDASKGYWLKNITKHPDMVWGGVEYDAMQNRTRRAGQMDQRRVATIKSHPNLFKGWPGTRSNFVLPKAVGESVDETDAYVMRWNQEHPKPEGGMGPLTTNIMRFEKGRAKTYPGMLDRACYHHALRNTKRKDSKLKLAVGFAVRKDEAEKYEKGDASVLPLMFTHAFNLTEHGEIHDTTLGSEGPEKYRYYGHVVPTEYAKLLKNGEVLANWFGRHFQHGHGRGVDSIHTGVRNPEIQHIKYKDVNS